MSKFILDFDHVIANKIDLRTGFRLANMELRVHRVNHNPDNPLEVIVSPVGLTSELRSYWWRAKQSASKTNPAQVGRYKISSQWTWDKIIKPILAR